MTYQNKDLEKAVQALGQRVPGPIDVALVLGSGLGAFADNLEDTTVVPYSEVEGLPVSTVEGHAGQFVFGKHGSLRVGVMQGRVHLYEGWTAEEVVRGVRALLALKAKIFVVTNASGAVSEAVDAGDLVVIRDHLNFTGRNPLVGENEPALGTRFPDMQNAYDSGLRSEAHQAASSVGLSLAEGVYAQMLGPTYETPAEVRMLGTLGGDIVGMSTVPEVIAARHMGVKVLGISCSTNRAAGRPGAVLDHQDVQRVANKVSSDFVKLLTAVLDRFEKRGLV
jgi:purine-nucleoside phosphorylase